MNMNRFAWIIFCVLILINSTALCQVTRTAIDPVQLGYSVLEGIDSSTPLYGVYEIVDASWEETDLANRYGDKELYRKDISIQGVVQSLNELNDLISTSNSFNIGKNGSRLKESLTKEINSLINTFLNEFTKEGKRKKVIFVKNYFQPVTRYKEPIISSMIFFEGKDTQVILRALKRTSEDPSVPDLFEHYASIDQAIEFRAVVSRLEDMFAEVRKEHFERVTIRLNEIDKGWSNYLEKGYSQYLWESLVNSYITPKIFGETSWYDPPNNQLVLMHPELGFALDTRSRSSSSMEGSLFLHALGLIHYFKPKRDWFLGISATASFPTGSNLGLGLGPTFHFGHTKIHSAVPHISLSVLWQDSKEGSGGPIIGVSLDLWRLFNQDSGESIFRSGLNAALSKNSAPAK